MLWKTLDTLHSTLQLKDQWVLLMMTLPCMLNKMDY